MTSKCTYCPRLLTIGQELSLGSCGEQFGIEELIPESTVKRLRKADLSRYPGSI